jgi:hypothetical protein
MNPLRKVFTKMFGGVPEINDLHSITPEMAKQLTEASCRSPDLGILEQSEFQLLFCPDLTMRGCSQHDLIEEGAFVCYAFTLRKFNYWQMVDDSKLPIPMLATSNLRLNRFPPPLKIKGEVHAIRSGEFANLDTFKDNLVSFRRERVKVLVPHRPLMKLPERYPNGKPIPLMTDQYSVGAERMKWIEVWMYVGVPEYWDDLMDAGYHSTRLFKTVETYKSDRPWLQEYYSLKREHFF